MREPYNPEGLCPKCGYDDISTTFCDGYSARCCRHPFEDGKHIDRKCRQCGYGWAEECLDVVQSLPQERFIEATERERCAKICDSFVERYSNVYADHRNQDCIFIADQCARAIRNL